MAFEVRIPAVGESVQEGEIYQWHKKSGEFVQRDEVLFELETDKATVEIVAEASGRLEVLAKEGATVKIGDIVARIDEAAKPAKEDASKTPEPKTGLDAKPSKKSEPEDVKASKKAESPADVPLSPAVSRLIKEEGLDPNEIPATGKSGRLTKEDVVNYLETRGKPATKAKEKPETPPAPAPAAPTVLPTIANGERTESRVKMSRLRQKIAERLLSAQHNAAMLTTFNEIDMSTVMACRSQYKDKFKEVHGVNLGFMSFFVKAATEALKAYPAINGYIDGTDIVYHNYCDVGIAVSTDKGLIVPVIRNAELLSYAGIEKGILDFAVRGRDGKINLDELSGGTFTITNGGVFGSLLSTPILNPPQSAILGMHKIEQRPIAVGGEVVIRPMMYVALSYDHRVVDGKEAVGFLVKIKECIEDPTRVLLGV